METYTPSDIVRELQMTGISYTTHAIRKQQQLGCIPSFKGTFGKRRVYDKTDLFFIKLTAYMRAVGVSLPNIRIANRFIYNYMYALRYFLAHIVFVEAAVGLAVPVIVFDVLSHLPLFVVIV